MATVVDDIRIVWDTDLNEGNFNFLTDEQDLESDNGLETAVIISLFSDRRAKKDDILPDSNSTDRRGWWGDLVSPAVEGDQIGSRLWLLNREKTLESVLIRAKEYIEEGLLWMLEDGVVAKIEVETERQGMPGNDRLVIGVKIQKIDGNEIALDFEAQWIGQAARG